MPTVDPSLALTAPRRFYRDSATTAVATTTVGLLEFQR